MLIPAFNVEDKAAHVLRWYRSAGTVVDKPMTTGGSQRDREKRFGFLGAQMITRS